MHNEQLPQFTRLSQEQMEENTAHNEADKWNPISSEQLLELEAQLAGMPDITQQVLEKLHIASLSDMRQEVFKQSIQRIHQIKRDRATVEPEKK